MKRIDFTEIINKSYQLVRHHRFLWLLGFFGFGIGALNLPSFQKPQTPDGSVGAQAINSAHYLANHPALLVVIIVTTVIVFLVLAVIALSSYAGLILAADELSTGKKLHFSQAFGKGYRAIGRMIGLWLLFLLTILSGLFIWLIPFFSLSLTSAPLPLRLISVFFALLFSLGLLATLLYLSLISQFAMRSLVLHGLSPIEAWKKAHHLLERQFKALVTSWAIAIGLQLVIWVGFLLVIFSLFFVVGLPVLLLATTLGTIYGIVFGFLAGTVAVLVVLLPLAGAANAFVATFLTLSYRAIEYVDSHH